MTVRDTWRAASSYIARYLDGDNNGFRHCATVDRLIGESNVGNVAWRQSVINGGELNGADGTRVTRTNALRDTRQTI